MAEFDFDVGIIGGGPAGSAMASYLGRAGLSTVVFERELFPRPHVGESLVPSSTRVFKDLNFLDKMDKAGFPKKYGAAWTTSGTGPVYTDSFEGLEADCHVGIRFEEREQPGVDRNYTFHVDRGKFDLMLLQHAAELGANVYEGVSVRGVDFSEIGRPKINYGIGKQEMKTSVRMVVDASGRKTLLGNQLKLRLRDSTFDQYAIHTWFEDYDRKALAKDATQFEFIFIHFLPISNSWVLALRV